MSGFYIADQCSSYFYWQHSLLVPLFCLQTNQVIRYVDTNPKFIENNLKKLEFGQNRNIHPKIKHQTDTSEQKKALGLCYKCSNKWFKGHKCKLNVISLGEKEGTSEDDQESETEEEENQLQDGDCELLENEEEQAVVAICAQGCIKNNKTLK